MIDRIIGAFTFKGSVYSEAKADTSFTQNAWLIVVVTAFLAQLGAWSSQLQGDGGIVGWLVGTVIGTLFAVGGFALACFVVVFAAKTFFQVTTTFQEMVRVLGLAYVWNIVGILAIVGAVSVALSCIVAPISLLVGLVGIVAFVFAIKTSLVLEWVPAIVIAVCAWVVTFIVGLIAGAIIGLLGFGAAMIAS